MSTSKLGSQEPIRQTSQMDGGPEVSATRQHDHGAAPGEAATTRQDDLRISVSALQHQLERGDPVTVLDIRPQKERSEWFIPGSIHIDAYDALRRGEPDAFAGVDLPEDRPVVTVCAAGKTSLIAAEQLRARGLQAASLQGGMKAWGAAYNTATVSPAGTAAVIVQVRRTGKGCLSYVIGAGRRAVVIDASLPPDVYVRIAEDRGWRITHVFDTHLHADHISRARPLAEMTGAALHLPEQARVAFPFAPVRDGDVLQIGEAQLYAFHTPGHTDDSTCYLLDSAALFTGDTLFTDGVGRPDLKASGEEAARRAAALYDSIRRLLQDVPPDAIVLPGHTGSPPAFDGRVIGDRLELVENRLEVMSRTRDEFVRYVLDRIPPTPPNFERIVALNEAGAVPSDEILDLEAGANRCAVS